MRILKTLILLASVIILSLFAFIEVEVDATPEEVFQTEELSGGQVRITGTYDNIIGELKIPEKIKGLTVTEIGDGAFAYHSGSISSVVLPDSLLEIGEGAFTQLHQVSSIIIPKNVIKVNKNAFLQTSINEITFMGKSTSVDEDIFGTNHQTGIPVTVVGYSGSTAENFAKIVEDKGYIPRGVEFEPIEIKGDACFTTGTSGLTQSSLSIEGYESTCPKDVVIPEKIGGKTVVEIGKTAFKSKGLTSVVIPDSVTIINSSAFQDNNLTSVEIPDSVTSIKSSVFIHNNLTEVTIPNNVESIENFAFSNNELASVIISNSATSVGNYSFQIQGTKKIIGKPGIDLNKYFTYEIGGKKKKMNFTGDINTPGGKMIDFESEDGLFTGSFRLEIEQVCFETEPSGLSGNSLRIKNYNKDACDMGADVEIPEKIDGKNVVEIGDGAFDNKELSNVSMPGGIFKIGESAFSDNNIKTISIPKHIEEIKFLAFSGNQLTSVVIPSGLELIDGGVFKDNRIKEVTLPDTLIEIRTDAFRNNLIEKVDNLPRYIGVRAFQNNNIKEVVTHKDTKSVLQEAFSNNDIEKVTLNEGIGSLDRRSFENNKIKEIVIPESLFLINSHAFENNKIGKIVTRGGDESVLMTINNSSFKNNNIKEFATKRQVSMYFLDAFNDNPIRRLILEHPESTIGDDTNVYHYEKQGEVTIWAHKDSSVNSSDVFDKNLDLHYKDIEVISMPDKNLDEALHTNLKDANMVDGINRLDKNKLMNYDLWYLEKLDAKNKGIESLKGIDNAGSLNDVNLDGNKITDLTPLTKMGNSFKKLSAKNQKVVKKEKDDSFSVNPITVDQTKIGGVVDGNKISFDSELSEAKGSINVMTSVLGSVKDNKTSWTIEDGYVPQVKFGYKNNNIVFDGVIEYDPEFNPVDKDDVDENYDGVFPGDDGCKEGECIDVDGDDIKVPGDVIQKEEAEVVNGVPTAGMIDHIGFKEVGEYVFAHVNKSGKNPQYDEIESNNKLEEKYNSVNKFTDLSIKNVKRDNVVINNEDDKFINSEETFKITADVCNEGNQNVESFKVDFEIKDAKGNVIREKTVTNNQGLKQGEYGNIEIKDDNFPCVEVEYSDNMIDIEKKEEEMKTTITVTPNVKDDKPGNNKEEFTIPVKNPNASIYLMNKDGNDNKNVITETGGVSLVVNNSMFRDISAPCGSDCENNNNTKANYVIRDITDEGNELVIQKEFTFNNVKDQKTFTEDISQYIFDYINNKENGKSDYRIYEFKVEASIPHYKGEVDYSGKENYNDNHLEEIVHYFPERPNISLMECNEFAKDGNEVGDLVKMCAGHYPNNPSTAIEEGMEAYHFVMYKFFPTPVPNYTVNKVGGEDKNSPEYFNRLYDLSEPITEMGDEGRFVTGKKGNKDMRGRYLPTKASFDFNVKEDREDGKTMASGTVSYEIPEACYSEDTLDLKHQYSCDEIMFFVPNSEAKMFERPEKTGENEYDLAKSSKSIPYINPGLYKFEVNANEDYKFRYQTNESTRDSYYWSKTKSD